MIEILWANGQMSKAETWPELEMQIRIAQWQPYKTRSEFRHAMAKRASLWTGGSRRVPVGGSAKVFLNRLAAAGLFLVVCCDDEDPTTTH